MQVELKGVGKRFNREWIFRNLDLTIDTHDRLAILGGNGSGKSTLLRIISGYFSPTEGDVHYHCKGNSIGLDELFLHIGMSAPYIDQPSLFTLEEAIAFHFRFKKAMGKLTPADIIELSGLSTHSKKQLRYFSSGMKQRLRLCLALLCDASLVLLDEPATNLDADSVQWYRNTVEEFSKEKTIVVCSNSDTREYDFCTKIFDLRP